jgi:type I restriction enzyme S subunit
MIPENWNEIQLSDVAEIRYGKATPKTVGEVPVIGSGGIFGGTSEHLSEGPTLVIGRKGTAGKVWLVERPCWPSDTTFYLQWKIDTIHPRFLYYFFQQYPLSGEHARTTLPSLQRDMLENYSIHLPPFPEQLAIARALNAVQKAKEMRARVLAFERERKAALMGYLFTDGVKNEGSAAWSLVQLGTLIAFGPQNGIYKPSDEYGTGTPIIRIDDFDEDGRLTSPSTQRVRLAPQDIRAYSLAPKDLLINRVNSLSHLGKTLLVLQLAEPTVFESNMMRLRLDESLAVPEYVAYFLLTEGVKSYVRGRAKRAVAQSSINQGDVRSIPVPLPTFTKQNEVVSILSACDRQIECLERETSVLDELFRALLEKLMTGQLSAIRLIEESVPA